MLCSIANNASIFNKVACPNCLVKNLVRAEYIRNIDSSTVKWYHEHEDYCEDIISNDYYLANRDNQYFNVLRSVFNIQI